MTTTCGSSILWCFREAYVVNFPRVIPVYVLEGDGGKNVKADLQPYGPI